MPVSFPTEAELIERCVARVADILGRPAAAIDPSESFNRQGLDSAKLVGLLLDIEDWLGFEIPLDAPAKHPSIVALAGYLVGNAP